MKLRDITLACGLLFAPFVQSADNPYFDFALHVAEVAERQNINASTWTGGFDSNEPPGGLVYRGFFDFDEDGIDDLILLSSVTIPHGSLYRGLGEGGFSKITDEAVLYNFTFAVSHQGDVRQVISIAFARCFANVAVNSFSPGGELTVSQTSFDGKVAASITLEKYGRPETARKTQKVTMMELLLSPNPNWTDANPILRLYRQDYVPPGNLEGLLQPFTPEAVIARIARLRGVQSGFDGSKMPESTVKMPPQQSESPTSTAPKQPPY